jgi:hypothetical protein
MRRERSVAASAGETWLGHKQVILRLLGLEDRAEYLCLPIKVLPGDPEYQPLANHLCHLNP